MNTNDIVEQAAGIIDRYNHNLAQCFRDEPFRRIDLAYAFARGFVKNDSDDINPIAELVIKCAMVDRDHRALTSQ